MCSMKRVPRLESNHVRTPHSFQPCPYFSRRETQILKIVISRKLQNLETSGKIEFAPTLHFRHQRVLRVFRIENLAGYFSDVPLVNLFYSQNCQQVILRTTKRNLMIKSQFRG